MGSKCEHSRRKGSQNRPSSFKARQIHASIPYVLRFLYFAFNLHWITRRVIYAFWLLEGRNGCLCRSIASFRIVTSPCSLVTQLRSFSNNYFSHRNARYTASVEMNARNTNCLGIRHLGIDFPSSCFQVEVNSFLMYSS